MQKSSGRRFFLALVLAAWSSLAAAETGRLIVQLQGIESDAGDLRFVIFDSKETFLKRPIRAEALKNKGQRVTWTVEGLPYGSYAVLVHHDLNANGKMERKWYGKPKEPTGTSNNPPARMGPPLWKKAMFELSSPTLTITIQVN